MKYLKNFNYFGQTANESWSEYEEEGSGYSYQYEEGQGATDEEIQDVIDYYSRNREVWNMMAKGDFKLMAQGEAADIKQDNYPSWKMSDFETVISALEIKDSDY